MVGMLVIWVYVGCMWVCMVCGRCFCESVGWQVCIYVFMGGVGMDVFVCVWVVWVCGSVGMLMCI